MIWLDRSFVVSLSNLNKLLMYLPEWAIKYKEPRTEIKFINGGYYKYEVSYKYNSSKKRTDKITGVLLGKITEEEGFIASDKNSIRMQWDVAPIDIKDFGLYYLFTSLLKEEWAGLEKILSKEMVEILISFAMFRWAYNAPIKRVPYYYQHDFCSQEFTIKKVTDKLISTVLRQVGERRADIVSWMSSMLTAEHKNKDEFVLLDSTHVSSNSELLTVNAKGYNPDFDFDRQIRLMYLFSADLKRPVYYRLINGNITDIKSMSLCVEEMKVKDVIYIADKGFYSQENVQLMKQLDLQYIIPVHRKNKLIDYEPLKKADFKQELAYFIYQKRIIWYYKYKNNDADFITFLDEGLKAREEADYVARIATIPEKYNTEKFAQKLISFGTLSFTYSTRSDKTCEEIYQAYKQRNEIELVFDSYKNFLKADQMYMQNRYVLEGWLTANFIAMIAYHKLYVRMKAVKELSKYAPKDIIEFSKSIYKLKINDKWRTSEITKKTIALFKKIDIDYLN